MEHIRPVKPSGYVTLFIWAVLMAAFVYGMLLFSEHSRGQFMGMFAGSSGGETVAMEQLTEVPQALRNQLQEGLTALAGTLTDYQTKLSTQEPPTGAAY
jgi:hypothetical protein